MRSIVNKIAREFVYGGHLLSLGASAIVWTVIMLLDQKDGILVITLAYLISQIVYNFDHLQDLRVEKGGDNLERAIHLSKTHRFQIVAFLSYIILFVTLLFIVNLQTNLVSLIIVAAGILYSVKLKDLTKKVAGFKNIYVSFFWSTLIFVPAVYYTHEVGATILSLFLFVFLRFIVSTIYFDIKDVQHDKKKKLKTLPAILGVEHTIAILHFINLLSGLCIIASVVFEFMPKSTLVLTLFPLYSVYYLNIGKRYKTSDIKKISYILVDGEYLFWPFVFKIGKYLFNYA